MSPNCKPFVTYQDIPACLITATNNKVFHAISMEDFQIVVPNGKVSTKVLLKDALHAPNLGLTIVLIGHIAKAGYTIQFTKHSSQIKNRVNSTIIGQILVDAKFLF